MKSDIFFEKLDAYNAPFLFERMIGEEGFSDNSDVCLAFSEFKKFVYLSAKYPSHRLAMQSPWVDKVWHQFILFTREYFSFCDEFLGYYFHHEPDVSTNRVPISSVDSFYSLYQKEFGKPNPKIWGEFHSSSLSDGGSDSTAGCCNSNPPGPPPPPTPGCCNSNPPTPFLS